MCTMVICCHWGPGQKTASQILLLDPSLIQSKSVCHWRRTRNHPTPKSQAKWKFAHIQKVLLIKGYTKQRPVATRELGEEQNCCGSSTAETQAHKAYQSLGRNRTLRNSLRPHRGLATPYYHRGKGKMWRQALQCKAC